MRFLVFLINNINLFFFSMTSLYDGIAKLSHVYNLFLSTEMINF